MSLVIRFSRIGRRGERKYRVVVAEKRSKRDGRPVDTIGVYEKRVEGVKKNIDAKKFEQWVKNGAQVSPSVKKALAA